MRIRDQVIHVPPLREGKKLLSHVASTVEANLDSDEVPIRFVVTQTDATGYHGEMATARDLHSSELRPSSIFDYRQRTYENNEQFNAVMMIPTGIDCVIGGHAGDATPAARLLASVCDTLFVHPNVVNASDINELTENMLSVEGSILCRLLMGTVGLQRVRSNRVLSIIEEHDTLTITESVINAVAAARATLGLHSAGIIRMERPCKAIIEMSASGRASGQIDGLEALVDLLRERRADYDAVAIISLVRLGARLEHLLEGYYVEECINPWGGIEAMLTHTLSLMLNVPTMHSPMLLEDKPLNFGLIDPRKAAEAVSRTFTHCILKGLHRSPRILMHPEAGAQPGVWRAEDISCLILPDGCLGLPTLAALEQGIPVIAVRGNRNLMRNQLHELPFQSDRYFLVENYLEAAGVMAALKAGVDPSAIRRPMPETLIEQAASARHNGRATSVLAFRGSVADAAL